jgi:CelD/BcsL family acetyltransferase involved in cellulose biosynthesis
LHPQFRKGIRRAERGGVQVTSVADDAGIDRFVSYCVALSISKGFELRVSGDLIRKLLEASRSSHDVDAELLIAEKDGVFGSGLFVMRVGRSMHQIWGATNRDLRDDRVGEACQWASVLWALERGCVRYDLEGIDPVKNRPVYEFKRRFGGEEVVLQGKSHTAFGLRGRMLSFAMNYRDRLL